MAGVSDIFPVLLQITIIGQKHGVRHGVRDASHIRLSFWKQTLSLGFRDVFVSPGETAQLLLPRVRRDEIVGDGQTRQYSLDDAVGNAELERADHALSRHGVHFFQVYEFGFSETS